jgi:hypothetical protein
MAWSLVREVTSPALPATAVTHNIALGANAPSVAVGNLLVLNLGTIGPTVSGTPTSTTATAGAIGTWQLGINVAGGGTTQITAVYFAVVNGPLVSTDTINVTFTATCQPIILVPEFSAGFKIATAVLDRSTSSGAFGTAAFNSGTTAALTGASDLILGAISFDDGTGTNTITPAVLSPAWQAPTTAVKTGPGSIRNSLRWRDPAASTAVAFTGTVGGTGPDWGAAVIAITATAASSAVPANPLLQRLVQGGLQRAQALLLIHPLPIPSVAAPVDANLSSSGGTASAAGGSVTLSVTLDASGGAATADGGTVSTVLPAAGGTASAAGGAVTLTVILSASGGSATAGGGTAAFSDRLTAASGTATAAGGTAGLSFTYVAASGAATAGGGTVSTGETLAAASGTATAGGGAASLTFTYASSGGAATAGGGTDALTFVYGLSGGTATAGGGDATASVGGASNVSSSGGTATGSGGTVSFAITLSAAAGAATAGGGTLSLTVSLTAAGGSATADGGTVTVDGGAVVQPPVDTGPTGGRYEPGGDESSITGRSARITSGRGHGYGWGTRAHVSARSRPRLRIKLPSRRTARSRTVVSGFGTGQGHGSVARLSTRSALRSQPGMGVGSGGMGRALPPVNGTPMADDALDDLAALTLLGVL